MAKEIKPKKRCCKSRPRCKRCPIMLKRLESRGLAERRGNRFAIAKAARKKDLKAARK